MRAPGTAARQSLRFAIAIATPDGAVGEHFRGLRDELQRRGHRVDILWADTIPEQSGNYTDYRWPSPRPVEWADFLQCMRVLRGLRPHCAIGQFGATNIMAIASWMCRVPVRISWYHTTDSQIAMDHTATRVLSMYLRTRKRLVYRLCTHIAAVSNAAADDARRAYGLPASKVVCVPNPLADPLPRSAPSEVNGSNIVCAGRLHPSKGQDTLLRAFAFCSAPGARLTLVGDGPEREHLAALSAALKVSDRVTFTGALPHDQVLALMQEATLTVVPSRAEAFGYTVVESMAVGTPVVVTDSGGPSEIVRDGVDGYVVPVDDHGAMADRIGRILASRALRDELGHNARQRFLDEYELSRCVVREADWLEGLVADALARRKRPRAPRPQ